MQLFQYYALFYTSSYSQTLPNSDTVAQNAQKIAENTINFYILQPDGHGI
jgi:hypothetical protein